MVVTTREREPMELYDLENDPDERRNLAFEPAHEEVRCELLDRHLNKLLAHLDDEKLRAYEESTPMGRRIREALKTLKG
jgi:hypothetical protein